MLTSGRRHVHVDRNPKWRFGDKVYFEICQRCEIKIEWQHEDEHQNTSNNFREFLLANGWKKRFLIGWCCEKH